MSKSCYIFKNKESSQFSFRIRQGMNREEKIISLFNLTFFSDKLKLKNSGQVHLAVSEYLNCIYKCEKEPAPFPLIS